MGESRWRVHGSTLLADSAGASGRMRSNTRHYPHHPSPPPHPFSFFLSFFFCSLSLAIAPSKLSTRSHARAPPFCTFFSSPRYRCAATGRLHREAPPPLGSPLSALQSLVFHSHSLVSALSRPFPLPPLPSYLITLAATPAPLTPLLPIILCPSSALSPRRPSSLQRGDVMQ